MNRINRNRPNRPAGAAGSIPDAARQGVAALAVRRGRPRMALFSLRISLANWCVWLAIEGRSFPCGPSAVASRLEELSRAVV